MYQYSITITEGSHRPIKPVAPVVWWLTSCTNTSVDVMGSDLRMKIDFFFFLLRLTPSAVEGACYDRVDRHNSTGVDEGRESAE